MIADYLKYILNKLKYKITGRLDDQVRTEYFKNKFRLEKAKVNKNTVFVIGDSHTGIFCHNRCDKNRMIAAAEKQWFLAANYTQAPRVVVYHLDAALAVNAFKEKSSTRVREKIEYLLKNSYLIPNHKLILSFGEIDCRVHVKRQSELQSKSISDILDDIVNNYEKLIKYLISKNFEIILYGSPGQQSDAVPIDPVYPRYGSEEERNKIAEEYNSKLQLLAEKLGLKYFSMYEETTENYKTKIEYYRDGVHLGDYVYKDLMEKVKKL